MLRVAKSFMSNSVRKLILSLMKVIIGPLYWRVQCALNTNPFLRNLVLTLPVQMHLAGIQYGGIYSPNLECFLFLVSP